MRSDDLYREMNYVIENFSQYLISSLGLAMKEEFKVESQRDASLRATELVASIVYGVGVIKDTYGVTVRTDTAL
jgi:hypothetical protein